MPFDFYPFLKASSNRVAEPRLRVTVTDPQTGRSAQILPLIDTGSSCCFFPYSFARRLKIKPRKGAKRKVYTAAGKLKKGYEHYLKVDIYGIELDSPPDNIQFTDSPKLLLGEVGLIFVRRLKEPVLGVKGFLDRYVYIVNHARKRYSVRKPVKDRDCEVCRPG